MAGKKQFKVRLSLGYVWDTVIFAKDPDEAKAIAEKELEKSMQKAGKVEFLQSSIDFVENYDKKVGKVAELARNIQKEQGDIAIKRLVKLAMSKREMDEIEARWAIDKLVQMELLRRVKPGILRWWID